MPTRYAYLTNGEYVIYGALGGNNTAWFDAAGALQYAEQVNRNNRVSRIRPHSARWVRMQASYGINRTGPDVR